MHGFLHVLTCGRGILCLLFIYSCATRTNICKRLNQMCIVLRTFILCLPNIVHIGLYGIQTLEQGINNISIYFEGTIANVRKDIFDIMGQLLHTLITHGARHSLHGMCSTKDFIDAVFVIRILLQLHDGIIQRLQMLLRFIQKHTEILRNIHVLLQSGVSPQLTPMFNTISRAI